MTTVAHTLLITCCLKTLARFSAHSAHSTVNDAGNRAEDMTTDVRRVVERVVGVRL